MGSCSRDVGKTGESCQKVAVADMSKKEPGICQNKREGLDAFKVMESLAGTHQITIHPSRHSIQQLRYHLGANEVV